MPPVPARRPHIGLALGGGGARGLAHILVLEALDELGVVPDSIAGTSIGAIYGAGYASGLSAKHLRAHTEEVLSSRVELVRQLFSARAVPVSKFLSFLPIRTSLFDAQQLMDLLLPAKIAHDFAALKIPLQVVATDFYAQEQTVFTSGPLRPAVAASMALPAIFTPVVINGRALVDGGLVNPLPFDLLSAASDITIAIDVSGAPNADATNAQPSALDVLMSSSQIFQRTIVREKLRATRPDIYLDCPVGDFSVLDFHRFKDVLAAAAPVKDKLKRQLGLILSSHTVEMVPLTAQSEPPRIGAAGRSKSGNKMQLAGRKSLAKAKALLPGAKKRKSPPVA
jgi:NTE family protein